MTRNRDEADTFAAGTGGDDAERAEDDQMRPGVTGGGGVYLPETGRAEGSADRAEGTVGAVGEMDFTGAPAGTAGTGGASGGSAAASSLGGGPGGGAMSTGGTGAGTADAEGTQSVRNTLSALGDNEPSLMPGGSGGAGGTGGAGGSDAAGESATTGKK
ncbi:MAG TPA: hypothetical protein VER08_04225 [Pyrinomonadaceae bacterium]|nr:hypothetical protein [Pyrinomonadaceae bacterium]